MVDVPTNRCCRLRHSCLPVVGHSRFIKPLEASPGCVCQLMGRSERAYQIGDANQYSLSMQEELQEESKTGMRGQIFGEGKATRDTAEETRDPIHTWLDCLREYLSDPSSPSRFDL